MPDKPVITSAANQHYQKRFDRLAELAAADDRRARAAERLVNRPAGGRIVLHTGGACTRPAFACCGPSRTSAAWRSGPAATNRPAPRSDAREAPARHRGPSALRFEGPAMR